MRRIFTTIQTTSLLFLCLLIKPSFQLKGQSVTDQLITKIPRGTAHEINIAEINDDAFQDIFFTAQINPDSIVGILLLQTDPLHFSIADTVPQLADVKIFTTDLDNNGQTDLILKERNNTSSYLTAYLNYNSKSGFRKEQLLAGDSILDFACIDFNNDGLKDMLTISKIESQYVFSLYLQFPNLSFHRFLSCPGINNFLATFLNNDGFMDLILYDELNNELELYLSKDYLSWDTLNMSFKYPASYLEQTDFNHDGRTDILILSNLDTTSETYYLLNKSNGYELIPVCKYPFSVQFISSADFTNDGLYDIVTGAYDQNELLEMDSLGGLMQIDTLGLPSGFIIKSTGDIDDDGDLDWTGFQTAADSTFIHLLVNNPAETNYGPLTVTLNNAVTIGDFTRFSWNRSSDDHTPPESISYDFSLQSETENRYLVTSDYDLENAPRNGSRNVSRHGYTGFNTIYLALQLSSGRYFWGVAGVDNSFYSGTDIWNCSGNGPCSNKNVVSQCLEITREDTLVCISDTLYLSFGNVEDSVTWGSLKNGVMEYGNPLRYPVTEEDEVYAIAIPKFPCTDPLNACVKNYNLSVKIAGNIPTFDFFESDEVNICQNSLYYIDIFIPDSLNAYLTYSIFANDVLLDESNPEVKVTQPTTISILASYANCHNLTDTLILNSVLPPEINIEGENRIFLGRSTILTASGALNYAWSPSESLDSPHSASILASPDESTTFTVQGWDEEGCMGMNSINVEIIPSVFIPELFTPNSDGNNDRFIIHGHGIDQLDFSIYDGNGRRIYRTTSVSEITHNGWDGTVNGRPVEPGTYVWIIRGEFENGFPLTFLGKNKGEIKIVW